MPTDEITDGRRLPEDSLTSFFVGRRIQLKQFRSSLRRKQPTILHVRGLMGFGKTFLLSKYVSEANASQCPSALIDAKSREIMLDTGRESRSILYDALAILISMRTQLGRYSEDAQIFHEFDAIAKQLSELTPDLWHATPGDVSPRVTGINRVEPGPTGEYDIRDFPAVFFRAALCPNDPAVLSKYGRVASNIQRFDLYRVHSSLCLGGVDELAGAFFRAVKLLANTSGRVVILLDHFEMVKQHAPECEAWLRHFIIPALVDHVLFVIAGGKFLERHWEEYRNKITPVDLSTFSADDVSELLTLHGSSDSRLAQDIHDRTRGFPLAVDRAFRATNSTRQSQQLPQLLHDVLTEFGESVLPDQEEVDLWRILTVCCVLEAFDGDLVNALCGTDALPHLKRLERDGVLEIEDDYFVMNQMVRSAALHRLLLDRRNEVRDHVIRALNYFEDARPALRGRYLATYCALRVCLRYGSEESEQFSFAIEQVQITPFARDELSDVKSFVAMEANANLSSGIVDAVLGNSDSKNIRVLVARTTATEEVVGFGYLLPLKRDSAVQLERATLLPEAIRTNLQSMLSDTLREVIATDCLVDSFIVLRRGEVEVGLRLMENLLKAVRCPRKIYTLANSDSSRKLAVKLNWRKPEMALPVALTNKLYVCVYDSGHNSPLAQQLAKVLENMNSICADCNYHWCVEFDRYGPKG